jgi:hypothetical protein
MNRSKLELMKDQLDKLDTNEHIQVYEIIKRYTDNITKSPNGVFISSEHLNQDCLLEMEKYIMFCNDQRKRMEDDMKTRKTYERMVE